MTGAVYLGIVAVGVSSLVQDPWLHVPGWYGLFMALPVYIVSLILVIPIARNRAKGQLQNSALAILGFIYLGWMFSHVGFLANSPHAYGYLLFLLLAVEGSDIAAFICGKLFGRHKLRDAISPNKTWGGALGALAFSMALPWLLRFSFPHFGPLQLVLTGLIVGIGGQLGDLTISMIKRDIGVKDMGALIPGHGGLLDRIDSLIFAGPLFFHMVRWFYDVYRRVSPGPRRASGASRAARVGWAREHKRSRAWTPGCTSAPPISSCPPPSACGASRAIPT